MSLKASWVSRLVSNQLLNWKVIPCRYFAKLYDLYFFSKSFWGNNRRVKKKWNPTTVVLLTLSGLLFQINLKHLLSISFLCFS
jgi:hypothetical protein